MLSVIIPAYDKHEVTTFHVKECMNSSVMPDEIVVVNDSGTPDLKEKLQELEKKCKIIYARINENIPWNYTGARNLGFWLSSGNILAFEDTDNIPHIDLYEKGLEYMKENPHTGKLAFGRRARVFFDEIKDKEQKDWPKYKTKRPHDDTIFLRRETYLKIKGCDERFAGRYAWSSADWRRRIMRAGIVEGRVSIHYFAVLQEDTASCECEEKITDEEKSLCIKCNLFIRRKSYKNYEMARERDGHIQSPIGILNFTYEFEIL